MSVKQRTYDAIYYPTQTETWFADAVGDLELSQEVTRGPNNTRLATHFSVELVVHEVLSSL